MVEVGMRKLDGKSSFKLQFCGHKMAACWKAPGRGAGGGHVFGPGLGVVGRSASPDVKGRPYGSGSTRSSITFTRPQSQSPSPIAEAIGELKKGLMGVICRDSPGSPYIRGFARWNNKNRLVRARRGDNSRKMEHRASL